MELLFVHGALVRDGAWWWRRVAEIVERETGVRSRAVGLPSCGEDDGVTGDRDAPGLAEDAAALRRALAESDGAVVVGHSYGGTVMAEGADHPSARHLVYITSYLPEAGTSQAEIMAEEPDPVAVEPGPDGALRIAGYDPETFGRRFWQDLDDDAARRGAWERVTAQSAAAFTTPTTRAAWQGVPSTYLICVRDGSTSLALQRRHAARATASFDLETGHHPFLSAPEAVAERLVEIVGGMRAA